MIPSLLLLLQTAAPPDSYWQQRLAYDIHASLDESAGTLRGTQRVRYWNNSPDTLTTISFHLYLNAFRPGSRWADRDSVEKQRRFNDLRDPDFGMNHVSDVTIMGQPVVAEYPFAPDSTIVRFALPRPLPPGDSLDAAMAWDARPSTLPRRQGRRGRAYDFAQWYPRVVAYDRYGWAEKPLQPAGEFYGDFGVFTVTLDLPEDQVVGATGVPLCGDPGWERASQGRSGPIEYHRDAYPAAAAGLPATACEASGPGRKTIVWRAEDVHHFAMSMRPDYRYEGGRFRDVAIHVLYQPGDEPTWGGNVAVERTGIALEWLDGLFGPYPWPQMTNVHRLEGGGTEFPMMMHNGSASLGLILHEGGHNYLMGVLANNEWREGFLDEGFTSFQTTWFFEEQGQRGMRAALERGILDLDLDEWSEPTSYVSDEYRDFATYNAMIYNRGELFYHQLREVVGPDTMRRILRAYYDRWKLRHVDEEAFRRVAEEVSGMDLSTFFGQWLHGRVRYDYAIGKVKSERRGDGKWLTRIELRRQADGVFPVEILVRSKRDSVVVRARGAAEREMVEVVTEEKPGEVVVDPRVVAHDWDMLDNRKRRTFLGWGVAPRADFHLDRVFSTRTHRDRISSAILPTAWYSDAGGATIGVRFRRNYLGRFNRVVYDHAIAIRDCCEDVDRFGHFAIRLENPTVLHHPLRSTRFELFRAEGRAGATAGFEQETRGHRTYGPRTAWGMSARWVSTYDMRFPDLARYDNAGTVELETTVRSSETRGRWRVEGRLAGALGVEYRNRGQGELTDDRYDTQGYFRLSGEAIGRRALGRRGSLGIRAFGGWVRGLDADPVRQRWFYLSGSGPYQQLFNPFLRSRGALLTDEVQYHAPGDANARGFATDVAVTALAALNVELDRSILSRPRAALFRDTRIAAFGDVAVTDGFFSLNGAAEVAGDAGVGVRFSHRLGETSFVTRFDFPMFVSHPDRAVDAAAGDGRFRFRWTISFSPTF